MLRRAQCLDPAFQHCIKEIIRAGRPINVAKQGVRNSTTAILTQSESMPGQQVRTDHVASSSGLLTRKDQSQETFVWSTRMLPNHSNLSDSVNSSSTFLHPLSETATSFQVADTAKFWGSSTRRDRGAMPRFLLSRVSPSALVLRNLQQAVLPSVFLACFSSGVAEVEIQPAPVKAAARMHEKLGEYAVQGVAWPRCAAILDPVCSLPPPLLSSRGIVGIILSS